MGEEENVWDGLSREFDLVNEDAGAVDNVMIAWPVLLDFIANNFPDGGRALDFGCGTGYFTRELGVRGFEAVGMDSSVGMINVAKQVVNDRVSFVLGGIDNCEGGFDLITSIAVFLFIENLEEVLSGLIDSLNPGGCILFVDGFVEWIDLCVEKGVLFERLAGDLMMNFGNGRKVKVYARGKDFYEEFMERMGMERVLESNPPYSEEFLERFPDLQEPTGKGKFMILGYRKV